MSVGRGQGLPQCSYVRYEHPCPRGRCPPHRSHQVANLSKLEIYMQANSVRKIPIVGVNKKNYGRQGGECVLIIHICNMSLKVCVAVSWNVTLGRLQLFNDRCIQVHNRSQHAAAAPCCARHYDTALQATLVVLLGGRRWPGPQRHADSDHGHASRVHGPVSSHVVDLSLNRQLAILCTWQNQGM